MRIDLALTGVILSVAGLLLVARKWNVVTLKNFVGVTIIAIILSVPFLWIYSVYPATWTRMLGVAVQVGTTVIIVLSVVFYRFWRDPERTPVESQGVIISPADGTVIYSRKIPLGCDPVVTKGGKGYTLHELMGVDSFSLEKDVAILGIEMDITNVHVNRCPIEGDVKLVKHVEGKYYSLRKTEAPFLNTRCTTVIANKALTVATVQISSRLVRRIDNYLRPGQDVCLGQRLGMIRFGSLVALVFPDQEGIVIEAIPGQKTQAGVTVLARYRINVE